MYMETKCKYGGLVYKPTCLHIFVIDPATFISESTHVQTCKYQHKCVATFAKLEYVYICTETYNLYTAHTHKWTARFT